MKILIPTYGYFPAQNYGGPPVSISNIVNLLHEEHEFFIITSDHDLKSFVKLDGIKPGWNKVGFANVLYLSDNEQKTKVFENIINKIKPDIIYLNTLFNVHIVLPFLFLAKKHDIKVLLAPRGELNKGALDAKYKKIPYIWLVKRFYSNIYYQSTCKEEEECIRKYLCNDEHRIVSLQNIPSFPTQEIKHFRNHKELKIIFISRISPKKNLYFALECLKDIIDKYIIFDIYGPIEDKDYWDNCKKLMNGMGNNINIKYKGRINHEDIFEIFEKYDLFFFPTLSENYGHVIAEALFSGVPVLISNQTPWTDVNEFNAGLALPLEKRNEFVKYIEELQPASDELNMISRNAKAYVRKKSNIDFLKKQYMEFFKNV